MMHSAARMRTDAGVSGSIIVFRSVVAAAEAPLLEPCDRLGESGAPGVTIGLLELGQLEPAQESSGSNASSTRSFVHVALSQKRRNRVLFLTPEFCSVTCHLRPEPVELKAAPEQADFR